MKFRYILIVSLLMAVISIGAVSASDDNFAVDGEGVSVDETPVEDVISSDEDGDVVGLVADDFKANVTEEIDLAGDKKEIAEAYYPEGAGGKVKLELENVDNLTVTFSDEKDLSDYNVGDKITFTLPSDISKGKYNVKLSNVDNSNVLIIKETVIEISNYTKDDFNIIYGDDLVILDEGLIFEIFKIPTKGTLLVSVDGEKRYTRHITDISKTVYVFMDDLNIDAGKHAFNVVYNTTLGREIELASFEFNVSEGTYWCKVEDTNVYYGNDFNGYNIAYFTSTNKKVVGLLKFYVNNVEKFSHNIISSDYKRDEDVNGLMYRASPGLRDLGISKAGKYNVRITLNGTELINSNATVTLMPSVDYPSVMSVGEKQYITVSYTGGSGTAKLYKYIMDDNDYDSKTPVAVFSIKNGKGTYSLSKLTKGPHNFYLNYTIGDKNYAELIFTVVKQNSAQIKATVSPLKITVGKTVYVTVKGPKNSNKRVEIYVDGKLAKSPKLKNGKVKVALSDLEVGNRRVRVMLDDFYSLFFTKTFDVKVKAKPIALSLKKVKVKKSAKKVVLKATLKLKGKLAKGKVVKFKFNKKAYKAKTNKKGVAKVTIKKKVLKKLKRGKKITYSATYKTVTKKVKVKVK